MKNVIIILNYNDYNNCVELLHKISDNKLLEHIVIVDNNSSDDSYEKLKKFENKKISIIKADKNGGYAYGNNYGVLYAIKHIGGIDNIIISNPDVIFSEDTIIEMERVLDSNEKCAVVGSVVHSPDGSVDPCFAWNRFDYDFIIRPYLRIYSALATRLRKKRLLYDVDQINENISFEVGTVHGCFFMIKLADFIKVGLFDERTFLYSEEDILSCKLMKLGKTEIVASNAHIIHKGSGTINKVIKERKTVSRYSYESRLIYMNEYLRSSKLQIFFYKLLVRLNGLKKT